ncbi:MAG: 3'-5' exonuclease [Anaerolineae bacterium]
MPSQRYELAIATGLRPPNWHGLAADDYRDILRACDHAASLLSRQDVLILDTETTDLDGEIIQLAVINTAGREIINTLVHPTRPVSRGAFTVHHISNTDLRSAPGWEQVANDFSRLVQGKLLVSYNAPFDSQMVRNSYRAVRLNPIPLQWECAMRLYASYNHVRGNYGDYRWVPLPAGDHSALGDTLATLEILKLMANDRSRLLSLVARMQAR